MSLGDLCALVGGRAPLLIEVKSHFDGDRKLVARMAELLASYRGPAVGHVVRPGPGAGAARADARAAPRHHRPAQLRRRLLEEAHPGPARSMLHLRHAFRTRPQFVAFSVNQLPAPAPWIARHVFGLPLLTWTVRTQEQRERAARYADQMIFEGFRPGT